MKTTLTSRRAALPDGPGSCPAERLRARLSIALRIAAAILGGYTFTWGFVAFAMAALAAAGTDFHDAEHAAMLPAFIIFLLAFLWAFCARGPVRVWVVLAGGGAAMTLAAWAVQRSLLG